MEAKIEMGTSIPKTQHYVPRFLLKNFSVDPSAKKPKAWVYDKAVGKPFDNPTSLENLAAENGFYNFEVDGQVATLEFDLSDFESIAAEAISSLIEKRNTAALTDRERAVIAYFVAIQFVRTRRFRENLSHIQREFRKKVSGWYGYDPFSYAPDPDDSAHVISLNMISSAIEFVPFVLEKRWFLMEAPSEFPFLISDDPIVLDNQRDFGPYGSIGFGVPGIEIYLPLNPSLQLAMLCQSHLTSARDSVSEFRSMRSEFNLGQDGDLVQELSRTGLQLNQLDRSGTAEIVEWALREKLHTERLEALESGGSLSVGSEQVVRHNADQIINAERFIYANARDFELVERILNDNPQYKAGPRGRVG